MKYYTRYVVEALHTYLQRAAFSGSSSEHTGIPVLIPVLISLTSFCAPHFHWSPPLSLKHEVQHSTPAPSPLRWGWFTQLWHQPSLTSDHSTVSPKRGFTFACFPAWKKCLFVHHKCQSVGVFHCPIPSPEERAALTHPTKLHQLTAKKTTQGSITKEAV